MSKQNFEVINEKIKEQFLKMMREQGNKTDEPLKLSWSNWGFGMENLEDSLQRLKSAGIDYIELHGNHYGADLGYDVRETKALLDHYDMKVSGVCGMFSKDNDLSSNRPIARQRAIEYIKRELEFTEEIGGSYLLVVPGAVGRPNKYDDMEFARSVATLQSLTHLFEQHNIRAAIEPVRAAEVSFVHTVKDALAYIEAVNHPAVNHINGDIYHMQSEESHIAQAILDAGDHLCNLHLADSNRGALGDGAMDIDTIIMALYILKYHEKNNFVTPEPLGPGGDPYPAMHARPDVDKLNHLVNQTATYFREREKQVLSLV